MFCPKCGTQNPDIGKFCRKCGTDLGNISAALSGANSPAHLQDAVGKNLARKISGKEDATECYGNAIKQIIAGIGFLIVAIGLLVTNVAGGNSWWWAMLFPAFGSLSKGVSSYMKSRRMEQRQLNMIPEPVKIINDAPANSALPPSTTNYVPADFLSYQTGDLVPPSVVENTTRHLEMDSEGETMTLPKSNL